MILYDILQKRELIKINQYFNDIKECVILTKCQSSVAMSAVFLAVLTSIRIYSLRRDA